MRKKSNKGFTLIELLAVVVIVGILLGISIVAVMRYIDNAKKEQISSQEKTMVIAAQNYLQENRGLLPKSIGETTTIPISVLKSNNYITETLKNSKRESCMENSYVEVSKKASNKYTYKAYLYCGDEEGTVTIGQITPTIEIRFVNANGGDITGTEADDVADARFIIKYNGGTRNGNALSIEGYSYSILIKTGNSYSEAYSSGTLSANHAPDLYVEKYLKDYIDVSNATTVLIKATVRNSEGGVNDKLSSLGGEVKTITYNDSKAPKCDKILGQAGEDEWININSSVKERKITVVCDDGKGSGCIRSTFTKTWTTSGSYENDVVQIKDNAGNITNCNVRVNIDNSYPIISIKGYARGKTDGSTIGNNIITGTLTTENSPSGTAVIRQDEYANLVNGYISNLGYPNGIIYKVKLKDNLELKRWKWEVNKPGIYDTSDSEYEAVGYSSTDNKDEPASGTCSGDSCSFSIAFNENGYRKGLLTVYDNAGNKSVYTIYANINRENPKRPTIINSSTGTSSGEWTSSDVYLLLTTDSHVLPISDYYYSYDKDANDIGTDASSEWVKLVGETVDGKFKTNLWNREINKKVYVMVCDVVGNCSNSSETEIKIDTTAPTGLKVTGYKRNNSNYITNPEDVSSLQTINSNVWYNGYVVIIPSGAKDTGGSGDVFYKVTVTGASENTIDSIQNYRNVNAEGTSNVSFKACDKVGNCSSSISFIVKLDRTGPTIPTISNATGGNWTKSDVTLTIGSSNSGVEIDKYYYSYSSSEDANWTEMTEGAHKTSFTKTWSNDINKRIYIKVCDVLGNCSPVNNTLIRIDKTAPSVPQINNPTKGEWANSNFSLTLVSSDGTGSGLEDYQYTYNENATEIGIDADTQWKSNGLTATENYTTTEFSIERDQLVYWRVCDAVGNCSGKSSTRIKLDKTGPTCGNIETTQAEATSGISGTIECEDSGSGCVNDSYSFGPLYSTKNIEMNDKAGNTKKCPISIKATDCSLFTDWEYVSLYRESSNYCPDDSLYWDYEFYSCMSNDLTGICSTKCSSWCGNWAQCNYVCCVERGRIDRTCYSQE